MKKDLKDRLKKIKLLILDVDGILTSGDIIVNDKGEETKHFNVQDGFGIVLFQRAGYKTAIITARASNAVKLRAKDLKISKVYTDASPKTAAYQKLMIAMKLKDDEVCFMGDDLTDLAVLKKVGLAITVPNAVDEVKKIAHHITKTSGGQGAVREVVELILKTQGKWQKIIQEYSK